MRFMLAQPEHEAQLRAIVRAESMPGRIQVTYEREPDFFHGLGVQGSFNQVVAAEENGRIVGFGCRSIRPMFINGVKTDFGYLSGLRSSPEAKGKLGIARGYRMFRELHEDGRCPGYITTIIEGNSEAFKTIAAGRGDLPRYVDLGQCLTCVLPLNRHGHSKKSGAIKTRFAHPGEEGLVAETLQRLGRQYQFFPAIDASDLGTPLLRDLPVSRFILAEDKGEVFGIAAIWDQSAFKQHRICSYSRPMQWSLPATNAALRIAGFHPLPPPGEKLNHAYCCFKAARNNDPRIMRMLLDKAAAALAAEGFSHLTTGFHADDPAIAAIGFRPKSVYRSRLFFVGWDSEIKAYEQLDKRIPIFDPSIL